MSSDRAAVAREVLTELLEFANARAETVSDTKQFMRERYPAPPETVTVTHNGRDVEWQRDGKNWRSNDDWWFPVATREGDFICRIASDAHVISEREARIKELEDELTELRPLAKGANDTINDLMRTQDLLKARTAERDAALRALEEKGLAEKGTVNSEDAQAQVVREPTRPASPAPIPLGAVVEVLDASGCRDQWHWTGPQWGSWRWEHENGRYAVAVGRHGDAITALYHARHPVASRETALQMCRKLWPHDRHDWHLTEGFARLRAAGFTLEGA